MTPILVLALTLVMVAPTGAAAAPPARIAEALAARLEEPLPPGGLRIMLALRRDDLSGPATARRARIHARQQRVLDALPKGGFRVKHRYQSLSGLAGGANRAAIEALARHPEVERVYVDGWVYPALVQGRALIGADLAWQSGFTGTGVRMVVLDTGIDTDHPDLADDLVDEHCFCDHGPGPPFAVLCCPGATPEAHGSGAAEESSRRQAASRPAAWRPTPRSWRSGCSVLAAGPSLTSLPGWTGY
jgi:subtilisin family serine protease